MVYELRIYTAVSGRVGALHDRFSEFVLSLFAKHGLKVVGFWVDARNDQRLLYLLRFSSEAQRTSCWNAFKADPKWQEVKKRSERDGPIVEKMESIVMTSPEYWNRTTLNSGDAE